MYHFFHYIHVYTMNSLMWFTYSTEDIADENARVLNLSKSTAPYSNRPIFMCILFSSPFWCFKWTHIYSAQIKKIDGPESAKYFSLLKVVYSFLHHCIMVEVLWYQYSFGKRNCLTVIGKNLFATPGPVSLLTTVPGRAPMDHADWHTKRQTHWIITPLPLRAVGNVLPVQGPSRQKSQGIQRHCFLSRLCFGRGLLAHPNVNRRWE